MDEENMLKLQAETIRIKPLGKRRGILLKGTKLFKIVLCGASYRGGTTFIKRYVTGDFERTAATLTVDFSLKHLKRNGENITLQLWDIAGQERTQTMSRMYYQDAHACIIMFDMTYERSLDICKKWKEDLDDKCTLEDGSPLPCLLLANKSDLAPRRKFTTEEIDKFSQDNNFIGFMETSVKTNTNVTEAMDFLVDHLLQGEYGDSDHGEDTVDISQSDKNQDKCPC